ncbi:AraC family transcriptional regulator [Paenibacillus sp. P96]|uniref:AraC family transcriptional regulator n=1 Tax=Paenibacillus zeirhizosphaerae TaxID=2987519 RepID=A0ABT9FTD4_9BACL|nr:AraC family transcriptional regulator [Paenibacillus sp. P96]MDP4097999.1 AraC family transcriptional regulator [Paenibacillus sp. P96]
MTLARTGEMIPREKVVLDKRYPIYIADTIGVSSPYQKLHWHDVLEINYIKSGSGYYIINGKRFEFQQGDILLINSNDLHCAYEVQDLVMQVIEFDMSWFLSSLRYDPEILSPYKDMGIHFTNLLDRTSPHIEEMRALLLELQQEHEQALPSYISMVHAHLLRFLSCVNRYFRLEDARLISAGVSSQQLEKMRQVIHAMEENLSYPWTLEELAAIVYLSPSRFSDIFRRSVGTSPLEYLIQLRLEHALMLLEQTQMKVMDIAMECGFRSLSNFNHLFKKHVGQSPKHARTRQN